MNHSLLRRFNGVDHRHVDLRIPAVQGRPSVRGDAGLVGTIQHDEQPDMHGASSVGPRALGSVTLELDERQLALVIGEVLSSVVVDVLKRHPFPEERVPARREVHLTLEGYLALGREVALQGPDAVIHHQVHPPASERSATAPGPEIVHEVERLGCRIEHGCEGLADAAGLTAKEADQRQEAADDHVAEQHVEQQLTVVPARAIGAAA